MREPQADSKARHHWISSRTGSFDAEVDWASPVGAQYSVVQQTQPNLESNNRVSTTPRADQSDLLTQVPSQSHVALPTQPEPTATR